MLKETRIGIRLDEETHTACKQLAPEGNISMWIRGLIRKEIESNKNNKEMAKMKMNKTIEKAYANLVEYAKGNKTWNEILIPATGEAYTYSINEEGHLIFSNNEGYIEIRTAKRCIDSIKEELCGMSILERKIEAIEYLFK